MVWRLRRFGGSEGCGDEAQCADETWLRAQPAVLSVPFTGGEVCSQSTELCFLLRFIEKTPGRLGPTDRRVKELFGPAVKRFLKTVRAIERDGDRLYFTGRVEQADDPIDREIAFFFGGDDIWKIIDVPEAVECIGVECQDQYPAAGDAFHLQQSFLGVGPMMSGDHGHGRVDGLVVEWKRLRCTNDGWCEMRGTLGPHGDGGLDSEHVPVSGLIGAGACADIEDRAGGAEGGLNDGRDPWVRPAVAAVADVVAVVIEDKRSCTGHGDSF